MPFGEVGRGEFGTYFIGYARTPTVTERMLDRMFLGDQDASHDRILEFSTAVTGTLFFAPTTDFLDDLPDPPAGTVAEAGTSPDVQSLPDDSLGIGDPRGNTAR
jgi:porphyrinogen peroxidase